jgi:hypothetical protein
MSHVSEYLTEVQGVAKRFRSPMPEHQRLVYAVESVVKSVLPSRVVTADDAQTFIDGVCADLDLVAPEVIVKRVGRGFLACASHEHHAIIVSTPSIDLLTLCHELAHLICMTGEGHHDEWRTTFVGLARRFVSVEHGALLHTLYNRCDLPTAWS